MINIINEEENNIISTTDIKNFLRIDFDDDNDLLKTLLKTATKQCELYISRSLNIKTYKFSIYNLTKKEVELPYPPVTNITSINITDSKNNVVEFTNFMFDSISNKIIFETIPNNFYRIDITYTSGYSIIPQDIKQGLLFHISKMYEDKTGYSPIPKASLNIYKNYKVIRF